MTRQYEMLRTEMMDNIRRQDALNDVVFSLLGISCVFSTAIEDQMFLILILFASAVLLSRIQQCRNTIYYISTYLYSLEEKHESFDFSWEHDLQLFRANVKKTRIKWKFGERFSWFISMSAVGIKFFANLGFCSFLAFRLALLIISRIDVLYDTTGHYVDLEICLVCVLGVISYLMNLYCTISICSDRVIRSAYTTTWKSILLPPVSEASDEGNKDSNQHEALTRE